MELKTRDLKETAGKEDLKWRVKEKVEMPHRKWNSEAAQGENDEKGNQYLNSVRREEGA